MPPKLPATMAAILAVMPDGRPIDKYEIYKRLGYAANVGSVLYAMEKRKLITIDGGGWRKVEESVPNQPVP